MALSVASEKVFKEFVPDPGVFSRRADPGALSSQTSHRTLYIRNVEYSAAQCQDAFPCGLFGRMTPDRHCTGASSPSREPCPRGPGDAACA